MKTVRLLAFVLLMVAVSAPVRADDRRNGATWYRQAWAAAGTISDADWEVLWAWDDPHTAPSAEVRAVLLRAQPIFEAVRRGTEQAFASYDLDYTQGFELQLPHLAPLRQVARLMGFETQRQLYDGDAHAAAESVATMYRMAGHLESDRTLISSLVAFSVFNRAETAAQVGYDRAAFDEAGAFAMLEALDGLDANDPFGIVEATVGEQELVVDWMTDRFATPADRQMGLAELEWLEPNLQDQLRFGVMTDEDFAAEVDQYDRMMGQVAEAFLIEDETVARKMLETIAAEAEGGGYGMLARVLAADPVRLYDRAVDARTAVRARRDKLEAFVRGIRKSADDANAAFDYAAAIEILRTVPAAEFAAVVAYANGDGPLTDEGRHTLERLGDAIDHLRRGTERARCDLSVLRPGHRPHLVPAYVAGMQTAIVLLHADRRRCDDDGDGVAVADRLAIVAGVVRHLSGDEPIASALVAHAALPPVTRALRSHGTDPVLDPARAAVLRLPRSDPFGYIASIVAARADLAARLRVPLLRGDDWTARVEEIERVVGTWNPARVLATLIVYDTMAAAAEVPAAGPANAVSTRRMIPSLIPPATLASARDLAPALAPGLARGSVDAWANQTPPVVVDLEERMNEARTDLRRAVQAARGKIRMPARSGPSPSLGRP
ncbi:MAG: hypothetical protein HKO59_14360 [Phycisphaerales bacterium]|nr:hypothetical protein [Phycisphaerae bacterium]NNF44207.1 hypothetical protein [Phycisphaerales bacterium]NNM27143.1 hypothetical protein [Phycisphaerales bacterium]